jgi:hypothetical protein
MEFHNDQSSYICARLTFFCFGHVLHLPDSFEEGNFKIMGFACSQNALAAACAPRYKEYP